ncbi:MAG: phosphodiester glycosidase family protein [Ardenticatenales bacterium]|nr:phosphodiester glycosidase family protein [Ardenticatenales bacterium]
MRRSGRWLAGLLALLLLSCNLSSTPGPLLTTSTPSASAVTPIPTPTASLAPPPTATPVADTGWEQLQIGLERRWLRLLAPDSGRLQEQIYLLRLQPEQFTFDIGYRPGEPLPLSDWQREREALIVMNGGFFTEKYLATGLVIADGERYGSSYVGFGGMLAITAEGFVELRSLQRQPYRPDEALQAALQAFPMLITPGGQLGYPDEDGNRARRSVIAQDRQGRILLIATSLGSFTLHELATFLLASDLDLDRALNLDGGTSTGLLLREPEEGISAFVPLPTVILVSE